MKLLTLLFSLVTAQAAVAQSYYCDRPRKPSCIDTMSILRDEVTFASCRSEVERYQRLSRDYQECLRMEFEDMAEERKKMIDDLMPAPNAVSADGRVEKRAGLPTGREAPSCSGFPPPLIGGIMGHIPMGVQCPTINRLAI